MRYAKVGRWTLLYAEAAKLAKLTNLTKIVCRCDCGTVRAVVFGSLKRKHKGSRSCGCILKESRTGISSHPLYYKWHQMLDRCENPSNTSWKNYGQRGIKVCERWRNFVNFCADIGEKPDGLTLERIDNDGDYCPENCRWASRKEQADNTRRNWLFTFQGETLNLKQWCKRLCVPYDRTKQRLYLGWSFEDAVSIPVSIPSERKHTPETIQKMSDAHRGIPSPMLGKKHTPETIQKISDARREAWKRRRAQKLIADIDNV